MPCTFSTPVRLVACLGLLVATSFGAPASTAWAEAADARASGSAAYQELIDEAVAEFRRGNYTEAYSLFERAHAVQPNARTQRGMGLAAFEERRYVACIDHLRAALADPRKPLTDKQRAHAEEVIQRAYGFVAQYTLELTPADAQVTVDSHPATIAEGILLLDPGKHEIVVSVEGHQETRHVQARPNDNLTLRIKLTARSPAAEPAAAQARWLTPTRKAGVSLASVGAASLVTGLALTLRARTERDESDCSGGLCSDAAGKSQYDHAVSLSKGATATVVVGGVAAAVGTALMAWRPREKAPAEDSQSRRATRVQPAVAPGFAGMSVSGDW